MLVKSKKWKKPGGASSCKMKILMKLKMKIKCIKNWKSWIIKGNFWGVIG